MDSYNVSDCVHGEIVLPGYVREIIDTQQFQRLKNLKQLGSTSYVFRSAVHNRAEHCIGTAYLCQRLLDILARNSDIDELLRKCVILGGLLHDIGHGPFSHLWEGVVHRGRDATWTHEDQSRLMIEFMIENNQIKLHESPDRHNFALRLITSLITGDHKTWSELLKPEEFFITEIVSNKLCNIDVDKVDYILRDQHHVNRIVLRDFFDFLEGARIVFDPKGISHIGYKETDFHLIENLFHNRAELHMDVYQNREVAGCEQMVKDICVAAAEGGVKIKNLPLTEVHRDQIAFLKLDDSVLDVVREKKLDNSKVKEAQRVLQDLEVGRHYECVRECQQDGEKILKILDGKFGKYFCIVPKKIPSANVPTNIPLYGAKGESVTKTSKLTLSYESKMIFCKVPELTESAKTYIESLNNNF